MSPSNNTISFPSLLLLFVTAMELHFIFYCLLINFVDKLEERHYERTRSYIVVGVASMGTQTSGRGN